MTTAKQLLVHAAAAGEPGRPAEPCVGSQLDRGELFPALPVIGYEQGDDLAAAIRHGFEQLGALRIWLHGR